MSTVLITATEPEPTRPGSGFVPPCSDDDGRRLAQAALDATIASVSTVDVARTVIVLDPESPLTTGGLEVLRPDADEEDERVGAAVAACDGPLVIVRPWTPQMGRGLITDALEALDGPYGDAVVGLTVDGSWWLLGLAEPDPMAVLGLPLRGAGAGAHLLDRIHGLGLALGLTDRLLAVERLDDAIAVAAELPGSDFAAVVSSVG
ncbi:MAG: DUF2064 domain-containing protein [Actinomycetota bacterium]